MKTLNLHIAIFFLIFSVSIFAQEKNTETSEKEKTEKNSVKQSNEDDQKTLEEFIDNNQNGIDDRIENRKVGEGKQKRKRAGKHFRDEDGDGINDNRCKGLGLGKGKGKKAGKKK